MVTVYGYYGHNNAGDDAFRLVFDQAFAPRPVRYLAPSAAAEAPDAPLVVGGGALVNDYFLAPLAQQTQALHIVGCSLPYGERDAARLVPFSGRLRTLLLRSHADVAAARKQGLPAAFVPDIVFALDRPAPRPVSQEELESWSALPPQRWGRHERTAILCLSDDYHVAYAPDRLEAFTRVETLKNELARALDELAMKFNLLFLPFSVWYSARDYLFAHDVVRRMRRRDLALVVERALPPERLMDVIAAFPGPVISMKYHGVVFALAAGRFAISIGSTRKNLDLMTDAGLEGLSFPYARLTAERLLSAVQKHREPRLLDHVERLRQDWRTQAAGRLAEVALALDTEAAAA